MVYSGFLFFHVPDVGEIDTPVYMYYDKSVMVSDSFIGKAFRGEAVAALLRFPDNAVNE